MYRQQQAKSYMNQLSMVPKQDINQIKSNFLEINDKKSELILIMNDYLTKKSTRVTTTDRLDTLRSKIA